MITAVLFLVVDGILHFAPCLLNWSGRSYGDVQIKAQQGNVFTLIKSMLIIIVILTVLVNLFKR